MKDKDEEKYVVYAEGTWYNYRALFYRRKGSAMYNSEANADKFSKEEAERIEKYNGSRKWIKKRV